MSKTKQKEETVKVNFMCPVQVYNQVMQMGLEEFHAAEIKRLAITSSFLKVIKKGLAK